MLAIGKGMRRNQELVRHRMETRCNRLEYEPFRVVNVAKITRNIKVISFERLESPVSYCEENHRVAGR